MYYVTMQITLPIPEFTRNERNFHCDVLHFTPDRVARLVLDSDDAIAAIQTSRYRPIDSIVGPYVDQRLLLSHPKDIEIHNL